MFDVPADRRYLESHEWINVSDGAGRVGISDFAQDELGDIVFVELPAVGEELAAGDAFGVVESIKAVSDIYAPVSGTVTAVNEALDEHPELLNDDPYGEGWLIEVEIADEAELEDLLSADAYRDQIE